MLDLSAIFQWKDYQSACLMEEEKVLGIVILIQLNSNPPAQRLMLCPVSFICKCTRRLYLAGTINYIHIQSHVRFNSVQSMNRAINKVGLFAEWDWPMRRLLFMIGYYHGDYDNDCSSVYEMITQDPVILQALLKRRGHRVPESDLMIRPIVCCDSGEGRHSQTRFLGRRLMSRKLM